MGDEKRPLTKEEVDKLLEEASPDGKRGSKAKKKRIRAFRKLMKGLGGPLETMFGYDSTDEEAKLDAEEGY